MNLTDILPLADKHAPLTPKPLPASRVTTLKKQAADLRQRLFAANTFMREPMDYATQNSVKTVYAKLRADYVAKTFEELVVSGDAGRLDGVVGIDDDVTLRALRQAAESPRVALKDLRSVAEKLGFLLLPFCYFDGISATEREARPVRDAIEFFHTSLREPMHVYVLTPIHYYSVGAHVRAVDDLPIYAPQSAAQAMLAISMSLPLFRTLMSEMDNLRREHRTLEKRMSKAETEIENLAKRVDQLAKQVEEQRRAELERQAAARAEAEAAVARELAWARDPLLFAFPRAFSITDDAVAIAGPCWGPDLDPRLVEFLALPVQEGQRKRYQQLQLGWQQNGVRRRNTGWVESQRELEDLDDPESDLE